MSSLSFADGEIDSIKNDSTMDSIAQVEAVQVFKMNDAGSYSVKIVTLSNGPEANPLNLVAVLPDSAGIDFSKFQLPTNFNSISKISVGSKKIIVNGKRYVSHEKLQKVVLELTYIDDTNAIYDVLPYVVYYPNTQKVGIGGEVAQQIYENLKIEPVLNGNIWEKAAKNIRCQTSPGMGQQNWSCSIAHSITDNSGVAEVLYKSLPVKAKLVKTTWLKTWKNLTCSANAAGPGLSYFQCKVN